MRAETNSHSEPLTADAVLEQLAGCRTAIEHAEGTAHLAGDRTPSSDEALEG